MSTLSNLPTRTNPTPAAPPKCAKSPPGRSGGALRLRKQPHRRCKRRYHNHTLGFEPKLKQPRETKNLTSDEGSVIMETVQTEVFDPSKGSKSPSGQAGGVLRLRKQPHRECKRKRFRNLNPKLSRALVCKNSSKRKRTLQCPPMKKLKTETAPTQTRVRQPEFSPTGSTFDRFLPHQISSQDWSLVADTLAECPDNEFIRIVRQFKSPSFFF